MSDNELKNNNGSTLPLGKSSADDRQRQATKNIILGEIDQIFSQQNNTTNKSNSGSPDIEAIIAEANQSVTPGRTQADIYKEAEREAQRIANKSSVNIPDSYNKSYHVADTRELNQSVDWERYHKAWQNYYQKYYEYYFQQSAQKVQEEYTKFAQETQKQYQDSFSAQSNKLADLNRRLENNPDFNPQNAALDELRAKIRREAIKKGRKIRKRKHFWPIAATAIAVLIFLFLQYNQVIVGQVMAYIAPGNMNPDTIVIDPTISISVSEDPILIIPVLNIEAPVTYDVPNDNESTLRAMDNGLVHYCIPGACAHPGEIGNTVISGHRTNGVYQTGDYKFIFLKLDHLKTGDIIYANYKGKRYTYSVTSSEVVNPTDVNKVVRQSDRPIMTLVTCTPIGSAAKRLLVHAEQIAPDPNEAMEAREDTSKAIQEIPGETKSFWQSLFGD